MASAGRFIVAVACMVVSTHGMLPAEKRVDAMLVVERGSVKAFLARIALRNRVRCGASESSTIN
jgi:hypothetical protein